jgi:hypothetical protein
LARYKPGFGLVQTKRWFDANQALVWCRPSAGLVQTKRWFGADQVLVWCRPSVGLVQTKHWFGINQALAQRNSRFDLADEGLTRCSVFEDT